MTVYIGECKDVMAEKIANDSVDLIVTSPPYADARKDTYGGVNVNKYVEWFSPIAEQIRRVLKPTGSFILNIKEKTVDGQRSLYVYDLVSHLNRDIGLRWVDEFVWIKTSIMPIGAKTRFKDGFERVYHFSKQKDFKIDKTRVKVPPKPSTVSRLKRELKNRSSTESKTGSGFKRDVLDTCQSEDGLVFPSNVLTFASLCHNVGHSAAFPSYLPEWFIKLLTNEGDTVLDPFLGSGTTYYVAKNMNRVPIGIEIHESYLENIQRNIETNGAKQQM